MHDIIIAEHRHIFCWRQLGRCNLERREFFGFGTHHMGCSVRSIVMSCRVCILQMCSHASCATMCHSLAEWSHRCSVVLRTQLVCPRSCSCALYQLHGRPLSSAGSIRNRLFWFNNASCTCSARAKRPRVCVHTHAQKATWTKGSVPNQIGPRNVHVCTPGISIAPT